MVEVSERLVKPELLQRLEIEHEEALPVVVQGLFDQGWSIRQICAKLEVSHATLNRYLALYGYRYTWRLVKLEEGNDAG